MKEWDSCLQSPGQAPELAHTGDNSVHVSSKSPKRLDGEILEGGINTLPRELLGLSLSKEFLHPRGNQSLSCILFLRASSMSTIVLGS